QHGHHAEDLVALLDVLGVDRTVVCGLSMGGYVALELLRWRRERIRALILMDSRAEPDSADEKRARDTAAALAREAGAAAIAEAMLPKLLAPATQRSNPETVELVRKLMESIPVAGIVGALTAMRDRADSTPLLGSLQGLPTLVVVGEHDQLTPPAGAKSLAAAIPGAKLSVIPGAGHLPPVEQPAATTRVLAEFLQSLA
ncbi:MAG: alpha/beta fold hydrolase, partial [Gemmatimonadales bacterium]